MVTVKWLLSNCFLCYFMLMIDSVYGDKAYVMIIVGIYASFIMFVKCVFALIHHWNYFLFFRIGAKIF